MRLDSADNVRLFQTSVTCFQFSTLLIHLQQNLAAAVVGAAAVDGAAGAGVGAPGGLNSRQLKETVDADHYWEQYLRTNDTIIPNVFQV